MKKIKLILFFGALCIFLIGIGFIIFQTTKKDEVLPTVKVEEKVVVEENIESTEIVKKQIEVVTGNFNNDEFLDCKDCNIILISLTNTNKDHLGIYGYERNTTPNLDNYFKDSLIFENAFAPTPWTLQGATSLYTSLFPYSHGILGRFPSQKTPESIYTLAEVLQSNGYKTAAFTGGGDYNRIFGLNRGFDSYYDENNYNEVIPTEGLSPSSFSGLSVSLEPANNWLKENYNKKFFLHIQGFDAHCPHNPIPPFDEMFGQEYHGDKDFNDCIYSSKKIGNNKEDLELRSFNRSTEIKFTDEDIEHLIALYDGEIARADDKLKKIFDTINELGLDKNTIIIFMAEHGELIGEHNIFMRSILDKSFYQPVLNFPLIIKHPKIKQQKIIKPIIQIVDIIPTLLPIINIGDPQADKRQGQNIANSILNNENVNEYGFAAMKSNSPGTYSTEVVRNQEWKLIRKVDYLTDPLNQKIMSYELYNLKNDPAEENNVVDEEKLILEKLNNVLDEKIKTWEVFE